MGALHCNQRPRDAHLESSLDKMCGIVSRDRDRDRDRDRRQPHHAPLIMGTTAGSFRANSAPEFFVRTHGKVRRATKRGVTRGFPESKESTPPSLWSLPYPLTQRSPMLYDRLNSAAGLRREENL